MIRLQLMCLHGDYFDAWFADRESFSAQAAKAQICCPHCGETNVAEAAPLQPGLYEDLTEDQARQMSCTTRRMLEDWMARGGADGATTATVAGAIAEQAGRMADPVPEKPMPVEAEREPPSRRTAEPKPRVLHYDC